MPVARYWRLVALESYAGVGVTLSACHLFSEAARVDADATLTATIAPSAGTLTSLQDTDTTTTCGFSESTVRSPGFALVWDLDASASVVTVRLGSTSRSAFLRAATLQYFDGAAWQTQAVFDSFLFPGADTLAPSPVGTDTYYQFVPLLLHFDGADGSSAVVDSSASPHTLVSNGVTLSTAQRKFGGTSGLFNGGATVSGTASGDYGLPGDFTVEAWVWMAEVRSYQTLLNIGSYVSGAMFRINGGSLEVLIAGSGATWPVTLTAGQWYHVAWTRASGVVRAWLDGTPLGDPLVRANSIPPLDILIGTSAHNAGEYLNGYLDEFRITRDVARYAEAFTPPAAAFPNSGTTLTRPLLRTVSASSTEQFFSESLPFAGARGASQAKLLRDMQYGGRGQIVATVKEDHDPLDLPVRRRVRLFRDRDGVMIRETWSDAVTGAYAFTEIDENERYSVVAYDHLENYRAVIADRIQPTVP